MLREVEKVVCYVVQDDHLLVFTHDDVPLTETGVQIPAGTIEPGESPVQAALRELHEETGRYGEIVRRIGTQRYDLRPVRHEIAVRHYVHLVMPDADTAERWRAGEADPSAGGASVSWTCWWLPLDQAHVLAAGFGGLVGTLLDAVEQEDREATTDGR